jgi:shikimate dehydrogenase
MITGRTKVFSILAHPVDHVRTPQALNAIFAERNFDGVVVPMDVSEGEGLLQALTALRWFRNWGGSIVTVPHKIAAASQCDRLTVRAGTAGAVNVIRREPDGSLTGELLDGTGFVAGLRKRGYDPAGRSVFLAGAGGAASAIAFALAAAGARHLTIANRSHAKSEDLANRLRAHFPATVFATDGAPPGHDLVVNGTSLGMRSSDPLPFDPHHLDASMMVAEVIMNPEETALLRLASARGCSTQTGKAMLEGQLAEMFAFLAAQDGLQLPKERDHETERW